MNAWSLSEVTAPLPAPEALSVTTSRMPSTAQRQCRQLQETSERPAPAVRPEVKGYFGDGTHNRNMWKAQASAPEKIRRSGMTHLPTTLTQMTRERNQPEIQTKVVTGR